MASIEFIPGDTTLHRNELVELNIEYLNWVVPGFGAILGRTPRDILGMDIPQYVDGAIEKICADKPPRGIFYLMKCDGALSGMGGLRFVRDGVCELKRVYVRPAFRGQRLGEAMLARVLGDARSFGYQSIVLDTAPFMQHAQRIYERNGFKDRPPYDEVEAPKELHPVIRFMEMSLL